MLGATLAILLVLLFLAVPVAATLGVLGIALDHLFAGGRLLIGMGDTVWQNAISAILVAVPMFIMLGEILLRAGIADRGGILRVLFRHLGCFLLRVDHLLRLLLQVIPGAHGGSCRKGGESQRLQHHSLS